MIVNLKTVPILLLLGCAGTDCGYPNVRFWQIVLQDSFWITEDKFSQLWARQSNNRVGEPQQLVMNSPATLVALEDTSIGDCRLVAPFAEKWLQAIFGVLQHYRHVCDMPTPSNDVRFQR